MTVSSHIVYLLGFRRVSGFTKYFLCNSFPNHSQHQAQITGKNPTKESLIRIRPISGSSHVTIATVHIRLSTTHQRGWKTREGKKKGGGRGMGVLSEKLKDAAQVVS